MNPQQLIEAVLHESPLDDGTIALRYLNEAQRELAQKSGIVRLQTTWSPPAKQTEHVISEIPRLLHIREIWQQAVGGNKKLVPTHLETYLPQDTGMWHVIGTEDAVPLIRIGYWDNTRLQAFDTDETFVVRYEAYPRDIHKDVNDVDDFTGTPELPQRWHDAIVFRALERAWIADPQQRSYYFARYREELLEAKREARKQGQNAEYEVKVYDH